MTEKNSNNRLIRFLRGFIPPKEILIVCILFYILGIVFAFLNPDLARLTFPGGMFLSNIEAKIQLPSSITLDYVFNQFFSYLGAVSFNIFLHNLSLMLLCIFSGIAIFPIILIGLFMEMGTISFFLVEKLGFTGVIALLGSFHIYFEFLAGLLAIDAFFKFYISFVNALKDKKIEIFKNNIINDFSPLVLRIILLLAIAAILEVFWSTWWVYILTNHYVSWYEFYFGAYSVLVK